MYFVNTFVLLLRRIKKLNFFFTSYPYPSPLSYFEKLILRAFCYASFNYRFIHFLFWFWPSSTNSCFSRYQVTILRMCNLLSSFRCSLISLVLFTSEFKIVGVLQDTLCTGTISTFWNKRHRSICIRFSYVS